MNLPVALSSCGGWHVLSDACWQHFNIPEHSMSLLQKVIEYSEFGTLSVWLEVQVPGLFQDPFKQLATHCKTNNNMNEY